MIRQRPEPPDTTTNPPRIARRMTKIIVGTLLAIMAFGGFLIMGWIPPELAAMLGSRRTLAGRDEDGSRDAPTRPPKRSERRHRRLWRRDSP